MMSLSKLGGPDCGAEKKSGVLRSGAINEVSAFIPRHHYSHWTGSTARSGKIRKRGYTFLDR